MRTISSTKELHLTEEEFEELWRLLTIHNPENISFEYSIMGNDMKVVLNERRVKEIKSNTELLMKTNEINEIEKKVLERFIEFLNSESFLVI